MRFPRPQQRPPPWTRMMRQSADGISLAGPTCRPGGTCASGRSWLQGLQSRRRGAKSMTRCRRLALRVALRPRGAMARYLLHLRIWRLRPRPKHCLLRLRTRQSLGFAGCRCLKPAAMNDAAPSFLISSARLAPGRLYGPGLRRHDAPSSV